ncbi:hypothetical protein [Acidiphilium multivorum]|jgi:hypothetical protein|uniref:hypothetical protein n=1 Tax=Acidiphilium multivorum TaxID=62140 RepID=UPI001F4C374A|nr:hypothetical protein [Acidiphilium multivorum]
MKRIVRDLERDLFETDSQGPPLPPDQKARLLPLIQALLLEIPMVSAGEGGGHEQDHA